LAASKEDRERAQAQFRQTVKAFGGGKSYTAPFEAHTDAVRTKTARLRELRLAKEAADAQAKTEKKTATKKRKPASDE
jgi:hypothetical protein